MRKYFTTSQLTYFSVTRGINKVSLIAFLILISGSIYHIEAQSINDMGKIADKIGYNLNDYHILYVGLTPTDSADVGKLDGVFTLSKDTIKAWGDYSIAVRFNNWGDKPAVIDVRNGGTEYAYDQEIGFNIGQLYHCWIVTVVAEKTYSVYIKTEGMDDPVMIAEEYAYRKQDITELAYWSSIYNETENDNELVVSNLSEVSAVGDIPIVDSTDATLSALSVSSGKLSPVFSSETTEYDVVATHGSTSVDVTATPTVANATVTGAGTIDLSSGSGTANVVVTALNGTDKKTYTINITVSDTPPSDDATLSALSVSTGTLDPTFDPSVASYTVLVPTGTSSVTVNATTNDDNASVTGDGAVNVSSGSGKATVVVTAEDGTTKKTYTVNITVGNAVTKITESQLKVFPNPAQHAFKISMEGLFSYEIYDITGALVINGIANDELYIGGELNSGAYLLKVTQEGRSGTFKLFKY